METLQNRLFHTLQHIRDGIDVGVDQFKALDLGRELALLVPHLQGELSSTAPDSSPSATASKGQGQLSFSHVLGDSSPTPSPPEPVLLCQQGKVPGPLSRVLQTVRDGAYSLPLMTSGLAHLPVTFGKGQGEEGISSLPTPPHSKLGVRPVLPRSCPQSRLTETPTMRVSFIKLPRQGVGPAQQSVTGSNLDQVHLHGLGW